MTPEQQAAIQRAEQAMAIARAQKTLGSAPAEPEQPPEGWVMNPKTGQMEDLRSPINPNIMQGRGVALGVGAGQGLGMGSFDEVVAGATSAAGGDYDYDLGRMREVDRRAKKDHPWAYYGGMIPGAIASSVTAGKALGVNPVGANVPGTMARGAGIGATEGAIWEFLNAEGGAGNRASAAVPGALIGGGVGAAAPGAVHLGGKALRAGGDLLGGGVDAMLGKASQGRAGRAVMDTVKKSGRSMDDISDQIRRAIQEGQPEFRLMDATGKAGQRRASGIARAGGDGAEEIAQFLDARQLGQGERVGGFIDDAFGTKGTTAAQTRDSLTSARGQAANTAYDAARGNAAPVDVRGTLGVIDDRIGGMQGSGIAGDGIDGKLATYRNRLAGSGKGLGDDVTGAELSDFDRVLGVKQSIQDDIGAAVRAGRNNEARELGKLVKELDGALEGSSDMYRTANDGFREASKVIGAVDDGAMMSSRGRAADNVPAFQSMNPEMQGAARIGYGDDLLNKMERTTAPTANRAKPLQSAKRQAEAEAMTIDPRLYGDRLSRENAMWETQNRALGGSRTADNMQDVGDVGAIADVGRAVQSGLSGNFGNAIGTLAARGGAAASGQNEATRALIAKLLMSDDPAKALSAAMRQDAMSQGGMRAAEAGTRAFGRDKREPIQEKIRRLISR